MSNGNDYKYKWINFIDLRNIKEEDNTNPLSMVRLETKNNYVEIIARRKEIISIFEDNGISRFQDFSDMSISNFQKILLDNNLVDYFKENITKNFTRIKKGDILKFAEFLGIEKKEIDFSEIIEIFKQNGLSDYYDFYNISVSDFKKILLENNLVDYFRKKIKINFDKLGKKGISEICSYLGFIKESKSFETRKIFLGENISNFYDFYYLFLEDFREIIQNNNLDIYFKLNTGVPISKASKQDIVKFANLLGFEDDSMIELRDKVRSDILDFGIENINLLNVFPSVEIISFFSKNNKILYYIEKYYSKSALKYFNSRDIKRFISKIGVSELSKEEMMQKSLEVLRKSEKFSFEYFTEELTLRDFAKIFDNKIFASYMLSEKGLYKSDISTDNIRLDILGHFGIVEEARDNIGEALLYLKKYKINNFSDLRNSFGIQSLRQFLWENKDCRLILNSIGLEYLQDFREDHIYRFARKVGLKGVPENNDINEENLKKLFLILLKDEGINDMFSFELYGIKKFRKLFKASKFSREKYLEINKFTKKYFGVTIQQFDLKCLLSLGREIGLREIPLEEYKRDFIKIFSLRGLQIYDIKVSYFKNQTDIWKNNCVKYIFKNVCGITDKKKIRDKHIGRIISFFEFGKD